jgi:hypothetical protein
MVSRRALVPIAALTALFASAGARAAALSPVLEDPFRIGSATAGPLAPPLPISIDFPPDPVVAKNRPVGQMPAPMVPVVRGAISSGVLKERGFDPSRLLLAGGNVAAHLTEPARAAGQQKLLQLLEDHPWQTGLIAGGLAALGAAAYVGVAVHDRRSIAAAWDAFSIGSVRMQVSGGCDFHTGDWHGEVGLDLSALVSDGAGHDRPRK